MRFGLSISFGALLVLSVGLQAAPQRILFVGNSYLYYNDSLHNHVKRMVEVLQPELKGKLTYKSSTIGGARLSHHPIDHLLAHENIGVDEPFEVVLLQGGSFEPISDKNRRAFLASAKTFSDKIKKAGAKPVFYMTHDYVPPHRRADGDYTQVIAQTYAQAGKQNKALVIPVGLAFAESYKQRPELSLHMSFDGSHPNINGTYLAACVVYLSLYGGTLAELEYTYFGELDLATAKYLQGIAQTVVGANQI